MQRDWVANDYYADLGLTRAATTEAIVERYRELAKGLHPDRNPDDPDAEVAFKRIARAYAVLSHPERRRRYDAARDAVFDRGTAPVAGTTRPERRSGPGTRVLRISPRTAIASGVVLMVLGAAAVLWILSVTTRDNALATRGVATEATVVQVRPAPLLAFRTEAGESVTTRAPLVRDRRNGGYALNDTVRIRYDRSRPTRVVVDESRIARDVTMWIIAVKLLVCGAILIGFGILRRHPAPGLGSPARTPLPA